MAELSRVVKNVINSPREWQVGKILIF
jgi:hypothetical protein